jgi:hypothetical protein
MGHTETPPIPVTHYRDLVAAMATKHQKAALVRPVLAEILQLDVVEFEVDTDVLGTFSGEIERTASPRDTAIAKARMGMEASGHRIGLASEGTIGPSHSVPFLVACTELIVLVDDIRGIVITGTAQAFDLVAVSEDVDATSDLTKLLHRAQFPGHAMIVSALGASTPTVIKGIQDLATLDAAVHTCTQHSPHGRARVETDLRAHKCPSRQPIIVGAARHLANRAATACPACSTPGYGPIRNEIGVPCAWCGQETETVRARIHGCVSCPAEHSETIQEGPADPGRCTWCNP